MSQLSNDGPDLVVRISGKQGMGKSCLMGDLAGMLAFYDCEVRCFVQRSDGSQYRVPTPEAGHFEQPRRVKLVEMV